MAASYGNPVEVKQEVEKLIKATNSRKAPGFNKIINLILKNLIKKQ